MEVQGQACGCTLGPPCEHSGVCCLVSKLLSIFDVVLQGLPSSVERDVCGMQNPAHQRRVGCSHTLCWALLCLGGVSALGILPLAICRVWLVCRNRHTPKTVHPDCAWPGCLAEFSDASEPGVLELPATTMRQLQEVSWRATLAVQSILLFGALVLVGVFGPCSLPVSPASISRRL